MDDRQMVGAFFGGMIATLLLVQMILWGWLPAQPFDWLKEQGKRTGALLYLLGASIAAVFGRKVY